MIKCIHRINEIERLKNIPTEFGVEVDLRADENGGIKMHHEPWEKGDDFEEFLDHYHHKFIILNVKEDGIENRAKEMCEKRGISDFFFLDVEFPFIYRETRNGEKRIAIRYSEDEMIEQVENFAGRADWVWIDTNTKLPLNSEIIEKLKPFKTALVCPERWGRSEDISNYISQMKDLNFQPDLVMTAWDFVDEWNF